MIGVLAGWRTYGVLKDEFVIRDTAAVIILIIKV